jgi:hypothetical protein
MIFNLSFAISVIDSRLNNSGPVVFGASSLKKGISVKYLLKSYHKIK